MGWVDAHCHLEDPKFEGEVEGVIRRAREAGVMGMINNAGNLEESRKAVETAEKFEGVGATIGVHPDEIYDSGFKIYELRNVLLGLARRPKVVAIGETGLDFREETTLEEKQRQEELFKFNIELAIETGLPVVVHCRNAFDEAFQVLSAKREVLRGVQMHCWTGNREWAERFLELGCYLSFGGMVTYKKNEKLREVTRMVSEDRILLETDAPYLAPEPVRGSRNEPVNLIEVAKVVAVEREVSLIELGRITFTNTVKLFERMKL